MPAKCCAYNCKNVAKKGGNVSFHKFPRDEMLLKRWVIAIRRDNFVPKKFHRLCSKHFTPDCVWKRDLQTVLKEGAVPTIFNFDEPLKKRRKKSVAPAEPNLKKEKINEPLLQSEDENIASETIIEDLESECPRNELVSRAQSRSKKTMKGLNETIKDLESVIEINGLKMKSYEAELKSHKGIEAVLKYKNKLLEERLTKLTSQLEESEKERVKSFVNIKSLESTLKTKELKLKSCEEKLEKTINKMNKSVAKCHELELKLKAQSKAELKSPNNVLERKLNNLALKLEASEEEKNLYAINIKNLESIIKTNETKLKSFEEELASIKESEAAMKSLINEMNI